ncbi:S-adenosylmethionine decarboxylase proenzyme [bacterium]|nr:MAG: S-adenosylmethionine decarboxylase proenzyme [bacterium]
MEELGTHIVCELSGCNGALLTDVECVRDIMVCAAHEARAEVMEVAFHRFMPQGVSGVVVIAESHLSIHTWPETGYAAVDIYTCGTNTQPWKALEHIARSFEAATMRTTEVKRGIPAAPGEFTHIVRDQEQTLVTAVKSA